MRFDGAVRPNGRAFRMERRGLNGHAARLETRGLDEFDVFSESDAV